jgi:zinc transporter 1/2/3
VASGKEFTTLLIALCFHQFFEGLALGSTIVAADFSSKAKRILMAMIYGITTPLGIAIGIAVRSTYSPTSPSGLLTQGILEAISGIFIAWINPV